MPTRTRSATRSEAATLSEAAMDRALGDPLIVRHILLQAAVGDARRVGRLAKAGRTFWQGSNGSQAQDIVKDPASRNCVACESCRQRVTPNLSIYALRKREGYLYQAQDEELYVAIAESFGWGPGSQRIGAMYLRLLRKGMPPDVVQRTRAMAGWPDAASKAKSVVRALGVNWAVHVHSIETVGGMGDEFYGEQWLNPVSRPKFVHATDAAQTRLPANRAPGGRLGLVLFPNPSGALLFNLYIPHLFKNPISLADRPGGGGKDPCHALNFLPMVMLQQLAHVALDASEFGPHLLRGKQLNVDDTAFLKPFAKPPLSPEVAPFEGLVAFSTSIDADKGVLVWEVEGRDNWTKADTQEQVADEK